jgi:hypothetical protein
VGQKYGTQQGLNPFGISSSTQQVHTCVTAVGVGTLMYTTYVYGSRKDLLYIEEIPELRPTNS